MDSGFGDTKGASPNDFMIGHRPTSTVVVRIDGKDTWPSKAYAACVFGFILVVVIIIILIQLF